MDYQIAKFIFMATVATVVPLTLLIFAIFPWIQNKLNEQKKDDK